MKIALIKMLNEKLPYWMKKPFSKIIRKRLICNKVFLETYKMLEEQAKKTEEEKKELQFVKLKELLIYAYENTTYYHKLFEQVKFNPYEMMDANEISVIPPLTKERLKENYEKLIADNIKDYYQVSTGGTSGEPIQVLMEKDAIYREWGFIYHYWKQFGYDFTSSRLATFRGIDLGNRIYEINPLYCEIRMNPFLMNRSNVEKYLSSMDSYGSDFLYGYPSVIYNFCRLLKEKEIGIKGRYKAVFLISENLYSFQKEIIEEVTACPIAMFYGHSERAVFGEQYHGIYYFNPIYGYTEIDRDNFPMVTGFINYKMPLIRYVVDDHVDKVENGYIIVGHHESEVLYGRLGEQISAAAINFHDDTFKGILAYQFVQEEPGSCVLQIVPEKELDKGRLSVIERKVQGKLGRVIECSVKCTDNLELSNRGKYKMIIQKWKGKNEQ